MRLVAKPKWKEEIPGDVDGGFILGKTLDIEEIASIESKCMKTGVDEEEGVLIEFTDYKRVNLTAKKCLTGWGNLFDEQGKEIKFSIKGLKEASRFMVQIGGKNVRFLEWVDNVHTKKYEEYQEGLKEATKNL